MGRHLLPRKPGPTRRKWRPIDRLPGDCHPATRAALAWLVLAIEHAADRARGDERRFLALLRRSLADPDPAALE